MKSYTILLSVLIVFAMFGSIRFIDDNLYQESPIILHANIDNRGNENAVDNMRVKFLVLDDYGYAGTSSQNNVRAGDTAAKVAYGYHDLEPGEYWVRIYAYGDDGERHIKHRPIIIQ
ncbi:hypothetical protein H6503_02070 [Candidatus Woesearchaeota archaeon]|nr:hypothetical protein [Candidatus Woesearchaeota archaeon]